MKYRSYYKWVLVSLACACLILLAAFSDSTSLAYTRSTFATPTLRPTLVSTTSPVSRSPSTVIVKSQPSSYFDPTSVLTIIGLIVQAATLIFIILYVKDTSAMAKATRDSAGATRASAEAAENTLKEMKEARDQESAPYVVAYFEFELPLIYFVVKNMGASVATNVRIHITPSLATSNQRIDLNELNLFKHGVSTLPPNGEVRTFFDSAISLFGNDKLPLQYSVTISYNGGLLPHPRISQATLDLAAYQGLLYSPQKDLDDLVESVQNLVREYKGTKEALEEIAETLKNGIEIKNPEIFTVNLNLDLDSPLSYILAKLKKFATNWQSAYPRQDFHLYEQVGETVVNRGENLVPYHDVRVRNECMSIANNISALLSIYGASIPEELTKRILEATTNLAKLANVTVYRYSNNGVVEFNKLGNNTVEEIEEIIRLVQSKRISLLDNHD